MEVDGDCRNDVFAVVPTQQRSYEGDKGSQRAEYIGHRAFQDANTGLARRICIALPKLVLDHLDKQLFPAHLTVSLSFELAGSEENLGGSCAAMSRSAQGEGLLDAFASPRLDHCR